MKDRADFNKTAEEILEFVDTYETLKSEYLDKFFPCKQNLVEYLIKNKRLFRSRDGLYISISKESHIDKALLMALNVLWDVFEKVKSHTKAALPVQISFLTLADEHYEIIYVGYGAEAMTEVFFETQLEAWSKTQYKNQSKPQHTPQTQPSAYSTTTTTKRIVLVEDKSQMEKLCIPNTSQYALVSPNGSLTYYRGG